VIHFGLNRDQFVAAYQRHLDRASKVAIPVIRELLLRPLGEGVTEAHVEIFLDETLGTPSVWIYHQGKNNKVDHSDPTIFPGKSMELPLGLEGLAVFDEEYFAKPESFPGIELAVPLLSRWVAESWWKAGGWFYSVPTMLAVHDYGALGSAVLSEGDT
jgi:hypothetical protein